MKALLFSDIHNSQSYCDKIVALSTQVDVVIGAGDYCNVHRGLETTIESLKRIEVPTILVPGNNENEESLRQACTDWLSCTVLHGQTADIEGVTFFGLGGGIPITPFGDWSFDLSDSEAAEHLALCPEGAVFISHSPPKGYLDLTSTGLHVGSAVILETIKRQSPRLFVCGHIHESSGQRVMCDQVQVINVGPEPMLIDI